MPAGEMGPLFAIPNKEIPLASIAVAALFDK
jgi:hypothetical protein